MAKRLQLRRGTTAEHAVFTGAAGEVTVDTTKDTAVVHDGSTIGGFPLARESVLSAHTSATGNVHGITFDQVDSKPTTLSGYGITDADTSDQVTTKINNAVGTAVSGLVNSAPGLLDTLDELANALGDDPNFATTVANNIATKVTKNADIVAGTGTKVTYDDKGLVTSSTTPTTLAGYSIGDAYTKTETDNKIAALVDSAPGTLDTLNELAAALGDDPSFATTVTNSIAGKASITYVDNQLALKTNKGDAVDSPTFTGTPSAPTQTIGDNSTKIATTEFVANEIENKSVVKNSAQALHLTDALRISGTTLSLYKGDGTSEDVGLPSTAPTSAQVGAATAGLSAGGIGTYCIGVESATGTNDFGSTQTGSKIKSQDTSNGSITVFQTGTWRCLGSIGVPSYYGVALWLRLA